MISREFVAAGKAIFTVKPPADFASANDTKPHYTFKVRFKKGKDGYKDAYFVSLLTGPENTRDYTYVGMMDADTGAVRLTAKSRFGEDSWPVKIVRRVLARIWAGEGDKIDAAGWKVHHEGKCGRCGRRLTVPESIENGIGPECIKHVFRSAA